MKIGTLCKVIAHDSHYPSQYGQLIVVTGKAGRATNAGICLSGAIVGRNLNTGRQHHYFKNEIKEVTI